MYLALLSKEEKALFLDLTIRIASIDGNYSEDEKIIINSYCQEMQISFEHNKTIKSVEEIIVEISSLCDIKEKRIIVFEIIGLAMVDGKYNDDERKIINHMIEKFDLEKDYAGKCENILKEYIRFQERINSVVIE